MVGPLLGALASLVGCNGVLSGGDPREAAAGELGETSVGPELAGEGSGEDWIASSLPEIIPVSPTRRLTQAQFQVSVSQAFGMDVAIPELPADESTTLEHHPEASPLGDYEAYASAATELGKQIAANLVGRCDFAVDSIACTETEILPALRVLYRFNVGAPESAVISSVISEAVTRTGDVTHGVALGVARALLEPSFLYRAEEGDGELNALGGVGLTPFEVAARLSFFSSDQPPSAQLFELAANGGLNDSAVFAGQAESAFAGDQLKNTAWTFMRKMLGLANGAAETDPLMVAMNEETRRFVEYILVEEQAPLSDLLNANYSFINAELAAHYGVPVPSVDWERYEFPESSRRRGIFTHGSFLSAHGREEPDRSWIFRGKAVYENLFCGKLPPPPAGVVDVEPKGSRTEDPSCRGCHLVMDPTGQFFGNFDAHGKLENSTLTPGTLKAGSDVDGEYADLVDFLDAASTSRAFAHCFVMHWFGEALGRPLTATDESSFEVALSTLIETGSLRAMLRELSMTPSFLTYFPHPSEQICQ